MRKGAGKKPRQWPSESLLDLGAGVGQYGKALFALDPSHTWYGFDGAGNVENVTSSFTRFADLTLPASLPRAHWVLSLEAGEHVPYESEMMFIRNLHAHNSVGVVISWAFLNQGGSAHINCHDPRYVRNVFEALNYTLDQDLTARLGQPGK
jgi:hypothetical protein